MSEARLGKEFVKAMILAAGQGKRMRPLTDHVPKPLLQVAGKALIEYHIEALVKAGITEIVINTAYLGEKIHDFLGDGSTYGASIRYSDEGEPLETLGGINKALALLGEEPFMVVNGDVYAEVDFKALRVVFEKSNKSGCLLLVENPDFNSEGDFSTDGNLLSNSMESKRYTFSGISILTPELIVAGASKEGPLAPLLRKAADKKVLIAEIFNGDWFDVGTPERLQQVSDFVAAKK